MYNLKFNVEDYTKTKFDNFEIRALGHWKCEISTPFLWRQSRRRCIIVYLLSNYFFGKISKSAAAKKHGAAQIFQRRRGYSSPLLTEAPPTHHNNLEQSWLHWTDSSVASIHTGYSAHNVRLENRRIYCWSKERDGIRTKGKFCLLALHIFWKMVYIGHYRLTQQEARTQFCWKTRRTCALSVTLAELNESCAQCPTCDCELDNRIFLKSFLSFFEFASCCYLNWHWHRHWLPSPSQLKQNLFLSQQNAT